MGQAPRRGAAACAGAGAAQGVGLRGFAITLGSALIAHLSVGDGPEAWGFAAGTGVLWGLLYSSGAAWRPRIGWQYEKVGREPRPVGIGAHLERNRRTRGLARL